MKVQSRNNLIRKLAGIASGTQRQTQSELLGLKKNQHFVSPLASTLVQYEINQNITNALEMNSMELLG